MFSWVHWAVKVKAEIEIGHFKAEREEELEGFVANFESSNFEKY